MATRTKSLLAAGMLASGMGSLLLTNAAPLSWVVASLSVWSTFLLAAPKDSLRQSWLHVAWAYSSASAFLFYLHKDPSFQVLRTAVILPTSVALMPLVNATTAAGHASEPLSIMPPLRLLLFVSCSLGATSIISAQARAFARVISDGHGLVI